jgi:hypothetical protein
LKTTGRPVFGLQSFVFSLFVAIFLPIGYALILAQMLRMGVVIFDRCIKKCAVWIIAWLNSRPFPKILRKLHLELWPCAIYNHN